MSKDPESALFEILSAHKSGEPKGIYSICSANPHVLEASARLSARIAAPLLIESTCNQVNQYGGYTGMTPDHFTVFVERLADRFKLPRHQVILGGDHLGPYPWKDEPAESAMAKGVQLVRAYVHAGYSKIHLDASMRCADDDSEAPLSKSVSAARTAILCQAAETAYLEISQDRQPPCYVIGTEVPVPGGTQAEEEELQVTSVADAEETLELTRQAFAARGLEPAWERVIALVVQPGVEFSDDSIHAYSRTRAERLSKFIEPFKQLVYEAHSTDYQTRDALQQMVEDHFAILKVGPALTFAFREAVFALSWIEQEWLGGRTGIQTSNLPLILDQVMLADPSDWIKYYRGNDQELYFARRYSFSDRSRYYWANPQVQEAFSRLFANLEEYPPPINLLSQFLPAQYQGVKTGKLENSPLEWVYNKIETSLVDYVEACRIVENL